jgi:hypothetical protein
MRLNRLRLEEVAEDEEGEVVVAAKVAALEVTLPQQVKSFQTVKELRVQTQMVMVQTIAELRKA